jgi:hypothetical protein
MNGLSPKLCAELMLIAKRHPCPVIIQHRRVAVSHRFPRRTDGPLFLDYLELIPPSAPKSPVLLLENGQR